MVLKNGSIVEKGTHEKLLARNGLYAEMWNRQAKAEKAAEDFKVAKRKAEKLMRKANIPHAEHPSSGKSATNEDSSSSDESYDTRSRRDDMTSTLPSNNNSNNNNNNHPPPAD